MKAVLTILLVSFFLLAIEWLLICHQQTSEPNKKNFILVDLRENKYYNSRKSIEMELVQSNKVSAASWKKVIQE
jgi:hypothetical protein